MKLLSRFFVALLALLSFRGVAAVPADSAPSTLIVLDASGSMLERIKGESKMNIAKRAVRELVTSLPEGANLGLVVYSHRKKSECDDIELLIPPGKLDKAAFIAAVNKIEPKGRTPLSGAIEFAAAALDFRKKSANVILVSDGVETCGKDPCGTATRLKKAGANLVVHTVAFDLSATDAKSIKCIASATGGRFLQAKDAASLKDALMMVVTEAVSTPKPPSPTAAPAQAPAIPISVSGPAVVLAGSEFRVEWSGPNRPGDFITLVPKNTPDEEDANIAYTQRGAPLTMTSLLEPGDAELRYVDGTTHAVRARAALKITPIDVSLTAAAEAIAGAQVSIEWKGPNNDGDYITIVASGTPDREYGHYAATRDGSPAVVIAPIEPGAAVIRYHSGQQGQVLAQRPIKLMPPQISLAAREEVVSGSAVEITWTGPNNTGDYITIVAKNTSEDLYENYAYTAAGSPLTVTAPSAPGDCEIRYVAGQGGKTAARRALKVVAGSATLDAPSQAIAGSSVTIDWTGPSNQGDYITIVPKGEPEGNYANYAYTDEGSPMTVIAPSEPGDCEIRYVSGQGDKTVTRRPIRIIPGNAEES